MRRFVAAATTPVAAALVFFATGTALAICPAQTASVASLRPQGGATGVPINGVIAFGTFPAFAPYDPVVTISSGGTPVTGGLISGPGGSWIFRPDAMFSPSTTYQVSILDQGTSGAPASATFTTGTSQDVVDPLMTGSPTLSLTEYVDPVEVDGCSRPGYWKLHVSWDPATDESPLLYAIDVELVDLQPEFAGIPYKGVITTSNSADVGVPQNSAVSVFVYAVDAAGRQGHSQIATLVAPVPPQHSHHNSCSCALSEQGSSGPWAVLMGAVALLALRRRKTVSL